MIEITDKVFRKMLDKAGLQDVHLFRKGKMIFTKKGEDYISANEMKFSDITKGQWVKTIKYWIETGEKFEKRKSNDKRRTEQGLRVAERTNAHRKSRKDR